MNTSKDLNKNKIGILLIIVSSFFTAFGQMFWKMSNGHFNIFLFFGFLFYLLGAIFMIWGFHFGNLSVLHPFMSVGYIFAIILGITFLKEVVTIRILLGIVIIIIGVALIGGEDD